MPQAALEKQLATLSTPSLLLKDTVILYGNQAAKEVLGVIWQNNTLESMFDSKLAQRLNTAPLELHNAYERQSVKYTLQTAANGPFIVLRLLAQNDEPISRVTAERLQAVSTALQELLQIHDLILQQIGRYQGAEQEKLLADAQRQVRRITRLAWHVSDVSQYERQLKLLQKKPIDITAFLQDFVDGAMALLNRSETCGVRVQLAQSTAGRIVEIDAEKLEQVLFNLLSNALKVSPNNGIVTVSSDIEDNELVISVSDEGPGFSYDEPETPRGTAHIGLLLVNKTVQLMNGTWEKCNNPNGGACVRVRLPLVRSGTMRLRSEAPAYNKNESRTTALVELSEIV